MINLGVICICVVITALTCGQQPDAGDQSNTVNGMTTLEMGRKYKNPLLRLIGTAMINNRKEILCSNNCGEWSDWSTCPAAMKRKFGMQTRSRQCDSGQSLCIGDGQERDKTEMDSKVCMGNECPPSFTNATHGFCLYFHDKTVKRSEADKVCRAKGSSVVNVNSKLKNDDVVEFTRSTGKAGKFWIDGKREDVDSPWKYSYETWTHGYSNWRSGQPNKSSAKELYMKADLSDGTWSDTIDTSNYVVCEFV